MVSTGFSRDTYTYGRIGAARPFTVIGLSRILKFFLPSLQNENIINGYGRKKYERRGDETREELGRGESREYWKVLALHADKIGRAHV